ncbi:MAG: hypothetical protein L7F78_15580 [Syntrophales bacterium LBB04]|nr:hypothetical protein [Syntrophales bacterium LBB04]
MNAVDIYRELEREFLSTFIGELLPGVIHNFANPLNGIMGRAKLLQRRHDEYLQKIGALHPGLAEQLGQDKITRDINTIVSETDRFFNIFRDLSEKVSVLCEVEREKINLSQLIEMEMRFADFYLDFKHDFKKNVQLDFDLPEIMGSQAGYSLCISALLKSAKDRMQNSLSKEIFISTSHDESCLFMTIEDSGRAISGSCKKLLGEMDASVESTSSPEADHGLYYSLLLLKQYGASIQIGGENGRNMVSLSIPY